MVKEKFILLKCVGWIWFGVKMTAKLNFIKNKLFSKKLPIFNLKASILSHIILKCVIYSFFLRTFCYFWKESQIQIWPPFPDYKKLKYSWSKKTFFFKNVSPFSFYSSSHSNAFISTFLMLSLQRFGSLRKTTQCWQHG